MQEGEEERELEVELQVELQVKRPHSKRSATSKINSDVLKFIKFGGKFEKSWAFNISECFNGTSLAKLNETQGWRDNIAVTRDFLNVIEKDYLNDKNDEFLRPLRWIVSYKNEKLLLISSFEANKFISEYQNNPDQIATTLRMFSSKLQPSHNYLINIPRILLGPSNILKNEEMLLTQLMIFTGSLFFESKEDQELFCQFLGFVPRQSNGERLENHKNAIENGCIKDGFILNKCRNLNGFEIFLKTCGFVKNPANFVKRISEIRNQEFPLNSHAAKIVLDSKMVL